MYGSRLETTQYNIREKHVFYSILAVYIMCYNLDCYLICVYNGSCCQRGDAYNPTHRSVARAVSPSGT